MDVQEIRLKFLDTADCQFYEGDEVEVQIGDEVYRVRVKKVHPPQYFMHHVEFEPVPESEADN